MLLLLLSSLIIECLCVQHICVGQLGVTEQSGPIHSQTTFCADCSQHKRDTDYTTPVGHRRRNDWQDAWLPSALVYQTDRRASQPVLAHFFQCFDQPIEAVWPKAVEKKGEKMPFEKCWCIWFDADFTIFRISQPNFQQTNKNNNKKPVEMCRYILFGACRFHFRSVTVKEQRWKVTPALAFIQ